MKEQIIDVDYIERPHEEKKSDIRINMSTEAALVQGLVDVGKEIVQCHTQYKMVKQEQETERKRIQANYRIASERLQREYDAYIKRITYDHERIMQDMATREKLILAYMEQFRIHIERFISNGENEMVKYLINAQQSTIAGLTAENIRIVLDTRADIPKLFGWSSENIKQLT